MKPSKATSQKMKSYKIKYLTLKKTVKKFVYENAALCDHVFHMQEKVIALKEERVYLLRRLLSMDPSYNLSNEAIDQMVPKVVTPTPSQKLMPAKKRDIPSEKGKTRKIIPPGVKRKTIIPVPVDSSGLPVFPVNLGSLSVHSLGEIITDRQTFHTEDFIYPVGFCSTRVYGSVNDPTLPCIYTCMILDGGPTPLFRITCDSEDDASVSGSDINAVHLTLLRRVYKALGTDVIAGHGKGAQFFGVSHPTVLNLLQSLPGIKKCLNYKMTKFEVNKSGEPYVEDSDPALTFESLQRSVSFSSNRLESINQQETLDSTATLRDLLNS